MNDTGHITPELFQFLAELGLNNDRTWFQANKHRYESHVKQPLLEFIADFGDHLERVSPHFVADARGNGGSMFRIYRDIRFSKDKTPYKTAAAMQFRHERARDVHAPGFYLHLEPGSVFFGAGMWGPDSASLKRIRDAIDTGATRWRGVLGEDEFASTFSLHAGGLKRAPKGFDPDHPLIEDLKRKHFIASAELSEDEACEPGFIFEVADLCERASGFVRFLTDAVGLRF